MSPAEIEEIKLALTDLNKHFKRLSERLDSREKV
jgi:hypothetical protein